MKEHSYVYYSLWLVVVFCLGISCGLFFLGGHSAWESESIRQNWYQYIDPLLECEVDGQGADEKYIPFEHTVVSRIQNEVINANKDVHLSVYFRNLKNGPWFWINENETFSPASLMKVPLLIAYLKWKEEKPWLFEEKMKTIPVPDGVTQNIVPDNPLEIWKEYTIRQLINQLIIESDNTASYTLADALPGSFSRKVYDDLGIPLPKDSWNMSENFISVKDYASFFRILYNASYLNRNSSEEALSLLSKSDFTQWIRKYIPNWVQIAHKFWERKILWYGDTVYQLHDCGIVYYTPYPYLLCVMTKGNNDDFPKLEWIIQNTSKIIFEEIQKRYN